MTDRSVEFAARYVNRGHARRVWGSMADDYGRAQLVGDPLADQLVAECSERKLDLQRLVGEAIARGAHRVDDAPRSLLALFAQVEHVPAWVDWQRLDHGARTYQRLGPAAMLILSAWSLMNGYRSGAAVKPLAFTGQLEKRAPRRLAETSRFVTEICQEGGIRRHGRGFELSVRVRIMHALVRRMLARSSRWDRQAWGEPINQGDMAGTVIEFSLLVLAGARKMGFHFTREEADSVVQLWRYCGYLSGVEEGLLAHFASEERGVRFAEMVDHVQPGPDDDSLALASALRRVPSQLAKSPRQKRISSFVTKLHDGLTWAFNGDEIASALGIPNRRWRLAIYPTRALVAPMELARRTVPGLNRVATRIGNHLVRADVERMLEGAEPEFRPARAAAQPARPSALA